MALDIGKMAGMTGLSVGDSSGWAGGVAQSSIPVTDLSPHVDGGQHSAGGNTNTDAGTRKVMHTSAAMVLVALALLWVSGTFVFKSARL